MKIALITHQFPSLEHPYIFDWIRAMISSGIDLWIITEKVTEPPSSDFWKSDEAITKRILRINLIGQPDLMLFFQSAVQTLLHPGKTIALLKVLYRSENGKLNSVFRKVFEYLPLVSEAFDLLHFNAPQIAIRRFELVAYFQSKSLISFRGQDFSFYPERYVPLLSKADHLHFISQHLVNLAVDSGYREDKHTIITPMVDHQFYRLSGEQSRKPAPPYILFTAARLEWMKGFEFA